MITNKNPFEKERWIIKTFFYICSGLIILICIQAGLIFARVPGIETMMFTSMIMMNLLTVNVIEYRLEKPL